MIESRRETALLHFQFLLDLDDVKERQRRALRIGELLRTAETVEEKSRLLREKPWATGLIGGE